MHLRLERWTSPLSSLLLVTDDAGALRALEFADGQARMHRMLGQHYGSYTLHEGAVPVSLIRLFTAYFDGDMEVLAKVQVATGGTPFQREVWRALRAIPPGTTIKLWTTRRQPRPRRSKPCGRAANGANPISIVVPCHRVIGANGTLTGYGGGLPRKRWLLDHEARFALPSAELHVPQCRSY